jgi:hypothetical protein
MSRRLVLGDTATGPLVADVPTLIDTRLLLQANSGGGKSWALRRLLEQTHGQVQQLVLDPEGEFASLRERYDYVLAAKHGGDTAADPRSAKLLAERLLELGVSAICDIYELKAHDRIRFVRAFLEALVDAPKRLWHPALVVVDEVHVYCPQQGEAESAGAVIDLATRGRKRGYCAILATQRLSKLHKDAAAELNNKLIGRTGLDVDVKRAADELGFGKERWRELRELAPGAFFAFGPALSRDVRAVTIGPVATTHPKAGARLAFTAPPPTEKVKALLPKLADLPAEAEARQRTVAELQAENAGLKRKLREAERAQPPAAKPTRVEIPVLTAAHVKALAGAIRRLDAGLNRLFTCKGDLQDLSNRVAEAVTPIIHELLALRAPGAPPPPASPRVAAIRAPQTGKLVTDLLRKPTAIMVSRSAEPGSALPAGELQVLTAIAQHGDAGVTREQLSILTGYKRSTRDAYVQRLHGRGLVQLAGGRGLATGAGLEALGAGFEPLPTGDALREHWMARLPDGERQVLAVLIAAYPDAVERSAIDAATPYKRSTRDAYLQRLAARKLVVPEGRGAVRAAGELFG